MATYRLIPLDDTVVFPHMQATLPVDVGDEAHVFLVPRHDTDYARVGVVAEVWSASSCPAARSAVSCAASTAASRARPSRAVTAAAGRGRGAARRDAAAEPDRETSSASTAPSWTRSSSCAATTAGSGAFVRSITDPGALADTSGLLARPHASRRRSSCSQTLDVVERLTLALRLQRERLAELQVRKRIREDVESGAQKQQRDYFLRRQMDSIRKELGEDDASVADEYRDQDRRGRHAGRGARAGRARARARSSAWARQSAESSMIRTYLDWLIAVPWSKRSEERLDPVAGARACSTRTTPVSTT